jgi:hypothetical protein
LRYNGAAKSWTTHQEYTMAQFDWPRQMFGAAVLMATMAASDTTMAQPIGTFRWQTEPHCNVLTLTVTAQSGTFQLQGFEEVCGGEPRRPVLGVGVFQGDGTVTVGLTVLNVPGGAPVNLDGTISPATLSGTWRDSIGATGSLRFDPHAVGGTPRLARPSSPLAWGNVTGELMGGGIEFRGSSNFVGLSRAVPSPGSGPGCYCLQFDDSVSQSRFRFAVLTPVNSRVVATLDTFICPEQQLGVALFNLVGDRVDGHFNFIVP